MSTTPKPPVTLATIAAHLNVSRSTVSNAYNHPDQLSPQLRERILETAAQLGYNGPDPVARRLRQGRAGAIGVLFSETLQHAFTDQASVMFLQGVAEAGEEADSGMLLIPARPSEESARVVQDAIVDGFVLYSIPPGHPFVDAALRRRLPVACVDQTRLSGVSWIGIDDRLAAHDAAKHLIDLGHTNIAAFVYGLGDPSEGDIQVAPSVSSLRLDGYADAFREAGLDWDKVEIARCDRNSPDSGAACFKAMLERSAENRPTAILCTSDALAFGVLEEASRQSIDVPDQLSVVGFNDLPQAAGTAPPLTTVRQPLKEKGFAAARLLFDGTAGNEEQIHLDAELVIRSSTARVPR
jgi:DNA-binding LacI/PurR family transcriptional regulator